MPVLCSDLTAQTRASSAHYFFLVFAVVFQSRYAQPQLYQIPPQQTSAYTSEPVSADPAWDRGSRILNGEAADIADYPFYGLIVQKNKMYLNVTNRSMINVHCGSSLISPKYFLTAFHCFMNNRNPKAWVILVGLNDRCGKLGNAEMYNIVKVIPHPQVVIAYKTKKNDIAIVKVNRHVRGVTPIQLPLSAPRNGELGVVIGFGLVKITTPKGNLRDLACPLQKVTQMYPKQENCRTPDEDIVGAFCAVDAAVKNAAACRGDSGGPWIMNRNGNLTVAGVSSFGDNLCRVSRHSDHYTNVFISLSWIRKVITRVRRHKSRDHGRWAKPPVANKRKRNKRKKNKRRKLTRRPFTLTYG